VGRRAPRDRAHRAAAFLAAERDTMDPAEWARAYLGVWPAGDGPAVAAGRRVAQLARPLAAPARAQLALDVDVDRRTASVAAAWVHDGRPCVQLVEHGPAAGGWIVDAAALARRLRAGPIGFDAYGPAVDIADEPAPPRRARPRAQLGRVRRRVPGAARRQPRRPARPRRRAALDAAAAPPARAGSATAGSGDRRAAGPPLSPLVAATIARARALNAPPRAVTRRAPPRTLAL